MTDGSGSEKRQRQFARTVRFNGVEDALVRSGADQAGVPIAAYIRCAVVGFALLREARRPPGDQRIAARLLAELGRTRMAFQAAAALLDRETAAQTARDFAEYRLVILLALGVKP